jgi:hypothetical protein
MSNGRKENQSFLWHPDGHLRQTMTSTKDIIREKKCGQMTKTSTFSVKLRREARMVSRKKMVSDGGNFTKK